MMGWAMELYEKGLLPEDLVGDLDLTWGNAQAMIEAVHGKTRERWFSAVPWSPSPFTTATRGDAARWGTFRRNA